ncbi:MAG: hypothetical protein RBQ63_01785 [Acholeplasmatales bacterium]|nr:hypothetical protein [Acholeplasmatales bacterium]
MTTCFLFVQRTYTLIFISDWIKQARELEILQGKFHDIGHTYQKVCINFPNQIKKNQM